MKSLLPKLPDPMRAMPKLPKLPKLPDPRQQVQGPQGKSQGWNGIYAPRVAPMNTRRKPRKGGY